MSDEWTARRQRYQLVGNAAFQAAALEREGLSQTTNHPAFRHPRLFGSLGESSPIPEMPMPAELRARQSSRQSAGTTMSPFVGAGRQEPAPTSPPINLGTTPDQSPVTTGRAFIEERAERRAHEAAGHTTERVPVFDEPVGRRDFSEPAKAPPKKEKKVSFMDKLGLGGRQSPEAPPVPLAARMQTAPKAAAVLGETATDKYKSALGRSPSKKKYIWQTWQRRRGTSDASDQLTTLSPLKETPRPPVHEDPPRSQTSLGHYTEQQRETSQPPSGSLRRRASQRLTSFGRKHLPYVNHAIPPTPPSKDTPPDIRVIRDADERTTGITSFSNSTPTQTQGFLSTNPHVSPSRTGSYGTRSHGAALVTQPSMHSMRGSVSVVPEPLDPFLHDRVRRARGLGIAGKDEPVKTPEVTYSPSMYSMNSPDPNDSPSLYYSAMRNTATNFPDPVQEQDEEDEPEQPAMSMKQKGKEPLRESFGTEATEATSGTIMIQYPEYQKDQGMKKCMSTSPQDQAMYEARAMDQAYEDLNSTLDMEDRNSPTEGPPRTPSRPYEPNMQQGVQQMSPMTSHPSCIVPPLRPRAATLETLPDTVYTPAAKPRRKAMDTKEAEEMRSVALEDSPTVKGASASIFAKTPANHVPELNVADHQTTNLTSQSQSTSLHLNPTQQTSLNIDPTKVSTRKLAQPPTPSARTLEEDQKRSPFAVDTVPFAVDTDSAINKVVEKTNEQFNMSRERAALEARIQRVEAGNLTLEERKQRLQVEEQRNEEEKKAISAQMQSVKAEKEDMEEELAEIKGKKLRLAALQEAFDNGTYVPGSFEDLVPKKQRNRRDLSLQTPKPRVDTLSAQEFYRSANTESSQLVRTSAGEHFSRPFQTPTMPHDFPRSVSRSVSASGRTPGSLNTPIGSGGRRPVAVQIPSFPRDLPKGYRGPNAAELKAPDVSVGSIITQQAKMITAQTKRLRALEDILATTGYRFPLRDSHANMHADLVYTQAQRIQFMEGQLARFGYYLPSNKTEDELEQQNFQDCIPLPHHFSTIPEDEEGGARVKKSK